MKKGILGKKIGMTRYFNENGKSIPATVIEAGPCVVTQIKTSSTDGYDAVQMGFLPRKEKHTTNPLLGHFKKAGVSPRRVLREFRLDSIADYKLGQEVKTDKFHVGENISVSGNSKGRGFAGTVKRYGFKGGPKSHGQSDRLRAPGSIGQSSSPSRVIKGMKMPGRYGNKRITSKNIEILQIDPDNNIIVVKGSVPGSISTILELTMR